jgi:hypothetical protein
MIQQMLEQFLNWITEDMKTVLVFATLCIGASKAASITSLMAAVNKWALDTPCPAIDDVKADFDTKAVSIAAEFVMRSTQYSIPFLVRRQVVQPRTVQQPLQNGVNLLNGGIHAHR